MPSKILIVDDEPDLELLIRQRFRREVREGRFDFLFARDGEQALAAVGSDSTIEVVLTDINMPIMDGLTLLGHLQEKRLQLGTVIVSAYGDMPNIRAAMNRGALDFLTKPIDFQDFERTVEKALGQVRALRRAAADRDRLVALQRDLETAAEIQRSFLPPAPPPFANSAAVATYAAMIPARAIGGDFYDYFLLDDGRLAVVVGDVSGKGVPAALFMAVCRTLVRATARQGCEPGTCLGRVSRQLLQDAASGLFVTLFFAVLDAHAGSLLYANGGHTPPFLLRASGRVEAVPGRGLPVGVLEDARWETRQAELRPGDVLFLYTDGVTEAMGPGRELFSEARLVGALERVDRAAPEAVVRGVLDAVGHFVAGAAQSDDLTAVAVRFADGGQPPGEES